MTFAVRSHIERTRLINLNAYSDRFDLHLAKVSEHRAVGWAFQLISCTCDMFVSQKHSSACRNLIQIPGTCSGQKKPGNTPSLTISVYLTPISPAAAAR
jgi:hypothetical protein